MLRFAVVCAILLAALPAAAQHLALENHDALALEPPTRKLEVHALLPGERILHEEARLGLPTFVWTAHGAAHYVPGTWEQRAFAAVKERAGLYRLDGRAMSELQVRAVHDRGRGAVVVALHRAPAGIPVFRDELKVVFDGKGQLLALSGYLPGAAAPAASFSLLPEEAVSLAARQLGLDLHPAKFAEEQEDEGGFLRFKAEDLPAPARVRPVWFHLPDRLLAAWHVEVASHQSHGTVVVDAADGKLLYRRDLVQDATWRVFADPSAGNLPFDGPQGSQGTPHPHALPNGWQATPVAPQRITLTSGPISTGDPWLPAGATQTLGNNVDAYADLSWPDGFGGGGDLRATTTSPGVFDRTFDVTQPPGANASQTMASVTQLFYVTNWLHDWFYDAGFDEVWRNAQHDNYGRGGAGGDRLLAEAQDFGGYNNANMGTPADGASPRMQMYLFYGNFERRLSVIAPASAATSYSVGLASFGPQAFDVSGELVVYDDGTGARSDACQPAVNDLAGKIALLDRGTCPFSEKVLRAEQAGAVGVVLVNNEAGAAPPMGGDDPGVSIPVLSVRQDDGNTLRTSSGLTVQLFREQAIDRDSAFDTTVVAHEFAHMVTNRLVGDAAGLGNSQGGALGEGWSDFVSLLLLVRTEDASHPAGEDFSGTYAIGGWVSSGGGNAGYYYGMRRYPYSVDFDRNPLTFRHIERDVTLPDGPPLAWGRSGRSNASSHQSGEVWAQMLWECYVALLRDRGVAQFATTRQTMLEILVESLKITPHDPTFLEARDAVLAAAYARDPSIYELFWHAFARRGAGLGAVAPERWNTEHRGVVESFEAGNAIELVEAAIDDGVETCDADGILDAGEAGHLILRFRNVGTGPLGATTVQVVAANEAVLLGAAPVAVPPTLPLETVEVRLPIALGEVDEAVLLSFDLTVEDPALAEPLVTRWGTWAHYDELPAQRALDDVESRRTVWTVGGDGSLATHTPWRRVLVGEGHRWHGPVPGTRADQWLVSPVLVVSRTAPLRLSFKHRYRLETLGDEPGDAGVIEISTDGITWNQVNATYDGVLPTNSTNPLRGRHAFLGTSAGWPALRQVDLNLGTGWAGQAVRVRFRLGSDIALSSPGWEIDDISFSGIDNLPFPAAVAENDSCGNQPPVARIAAPAEVPERSTVTLDGSVSFDPDWDPLQYTWQQLSGPAVEWLQSTGPVVRFVAPELEADAVAVFSLEVRDGSASGFVEHELLIRNVNREPVALVTGAQTTVRGRVVELDGSESFDPDGDAITYTWSQLRGPDVIEDPHGPVLRFVAPEVTSFTQLRIQLVVSDGQGESEPAIHDITVAPNNRAPVAFVGRALRVDERSRVELRDAGGTDADGDPLTFRWYQVEGTEAAFENADTLEATLLVPEVAADETLVIALVANDGELDSQPALLEVHVRDVNAAPVVALVPQLIVKAGHLVALDASASEDPEGEPITFEWRQLDGPAVELQGADQSQASFVAPAAGSVLVFEVEVTDPHGASGVAEVLVRVQRDGEESGCGCSGAGPGSALQLLAWAVVALALRRRKAAAVTSVA